MKLSRLITKAADTAMPHIDKCVACSIEKGVESFLCKRCCDEINARKHGDTKAKDLCAFSVYDYEGLVSKVVRDYKYNGKRYLCAYIASEMAAAVKGDYSAICHVPLHKKRLRRRGFDQAELLAKGIAKITDIPFVRAAKRTRNTRTQVSLGLVQRQENMKGAFVSTGPISGNVVLVDDVLTTGATAAECAAVLLGAGASDVFVLTFARSTGDATRKRKWSVRKMFDILKPRNFRSK
jgi:competence protein ComFC